MGLRVGDELGLRVGAAGLLDLDDALEGHAVVIDADEDRVLVGVNDDRVPLEGVIQVEKPGGADAQAKLVSYA
jgi:hypothetical protein